MVRMLAAKYWTRLLPAHSMLAATARNASFPTSTSKVCGPTLRDVSVSEDGERLDVCWADGKKYEFASCWLKENCPSPSIIDPTSHGRLLLMSDFNIDIKILQVQFTGQAVCVEWDQGGVSNYTTDWLRDRTWQDQGTPRILWGGCHQLHKHDYTAVIHNKEAMLAWLEDLVRFGITIVENTPCTTHSLQELQREVGAAKNTHFGTFFNVITKPDPINVAYTSATLGLHLDLPFYSYCPGVQFLQCIKQFHGTGGENHFVDGFAVADVMKNEHPEEFELLCNTEVNYWDAGMLDDDSIAHGVSDSSRKFHKRHSTPTFRLGPGGELKQVTFNQQVRSSQLCGDAAQTKCLLRALKLFNTICYDPRYLVQYKLREGDIAVFDNKRVLHGRQGFIVGEGEDGARHLQGCYIDWDEIDDRLHVLRETPLI